MVCKVQNNSVVGTFLRSMMRIHNFKNLGKSNLFKIDTKILISGFAVG